MTRKFISVDANSGWCAKYRRRNAHCPVKRPESAKRIVYRCSQNAKKRYFNRAGNIRRKSFQCWDFFREGIRDLSKAVRRICDEYPPLAASRHDNCLGVRQRKDESPADFHRQLPVDSLVSRLIYNDYRRSGADGGLPTFVWV